LFGVFAEERGSHECLGNGYEPAIRIAPEYIIFIFENTKIYKQTPDVCNNFDLPIYY
jgi:hypothetical protein